MVYIVIRLIDNLIFLESRCFYNLLAGVLFENKISSVGIQRSDVGIYPENFSEEAAKLLARYLRDKN